MSIDPAVYARLREIADMLPQVPGIGKVEIADGEIIMMMSPVKRHELAVLRIARQLNAQLPTTHPGHIAYHGADLEDTGLGQLRNPDLMVFSEPGYASREKFAFGDTITVGPWTLDTSVLRTYA
ncbi:Uma2 family endonuclease [Kitasatospora sp. NPDC001660]